MSKKNIHLSYKKMKIKQRPIPEAALLDPNSVEMLRVWIAGGSLHCSLKIGMYAEAKKMPESRAWGVILADVAKHVSNALHEMNYEDGDLMEKIKDSFVREVDRPTSNAPGGFVKKH